MRIHREENEKRLGVLTTSITGSTVQTSDLKPGAGGENGHGGDEIGYAEIASIGWGRLKRSVSAAMQWQ